MISFASAVGNYFNRLGRLGGLVDSLETYQASLYVQMTDQTVGLEGQYTGEPDIQAQMGSTYISILGSTGGTISNLVQGMAATTTNRVVFRDSPQLNQTLTSTNLSASLNEIIRQMGQAGATVLAQTVAATTTSFTGVGNGVLVVSVKRPSDGRMVENAFAETLTFTVTSDSYQDGATAGNESLSVTGEGSQGDVFAFDWPLGSNCQSNVSSIDGNSDNSAGNGLTNSGFETYTVANTPDDWEIVLGTAGVNFFEQTSIVYDGLASLQWTGDGSTLCQIRQLFGSATGTPATLSVLSQYSTCLFLRRDGSVPATGTLEVALADAAGNVINDEAGVPNLFTVDLTALNTVFTPYTGIFRTPLIMPADIYYRVRTSVAYDSGKSFYLDKASMGAMTQLYSGGPSVAVHSGSTPYIDGDYAFATITNSRGAGGTLNTWQTFLYRCFGDLDLLFPSSSSPTVSDSLIV